MAKILVVIDMQKGTAQGRYHQQYLNRKWWKRHAEVVERIKHLAQRVDTIIFLIITSFRKKENLEIVDNLKQLSRNTLVVFKDEDDGSYALVEHLSKKDNLLLCGMNTNACVIRTARGLKRKGFKLSVVGDACWTVFAAKSSQCHYDALNRIRRYGIKTITTEAVR